MLSIQKFSAEDIEKIQEMPKARKVYYLLFALCIPISFLAGLVGLLKKGYGYWPTTLGFLLFFFCVIIWLIAKEIFLYRKDLAKQEKLTGTTKVISKSQKRTRL
jgi:fatty acid desaturase